MNRTATLARIEARLPQMARAEASVARAVLADPERAIRTSLAALAAGAGVSEPTVIRFCRSLGFEGYPDFKIGLAQDIAGGVPFVSPHVAAGDPPDILARKIFASAVGALQATAIGLSGERVGAAIDALASAGRLLAFGAGGSAAVALDAQHKLLRLGLHCHQTADPVLARMLLPTLAPGDLLLALSYTGRTLAVLELARLARGRGLRVVAITAAETPLAAAADVLLAVPASEDGELFTPMAARLAMLAMIDVVSTGLALRRGGDGVAHLAEVKALLQETRLPSAAPEGDEKAEL
ncbi:MAG TPA: SIS domain-containing protein [Alphaproteobacteria bacterium]|nr:SIS domain-containing protein [Alphaproteobacteria bacterium]